MSDCLLQLVTSNQNACSRKDAMMFVKLGILYVQNRTQRVVDGPSGEPSSTHSPSPIRCSHNLEFMLLLPT